MKNRIERLVIHRTATVYSQEVKVAGIRCWPCSPKPKKVLGEYKSFYTVMAYT